MSSCLGVEFPEMTLGPFGAFLSKGTPQPQEDLAPKLPSQGEAMDLALTSQGLMETVYFSPKIILYLSPVRF